MTPSQLKLLNERLRREEECLNLMHGVQHSSIVVNHSEHNDSFLVKASVKLTDGCEVGKLFHVMNLDRGFVAVRKWLTNLIGHDN